VSSHGIIWANWQRERAVVLTLADAGLLDEKGGLADEAGPGWKKAQLAAQGGARRKARAAATKTAKPLWEEKDGGVSGTA